MSSSVTLCYRIDRGRVSAQHSIPYDTSSLPPCRFGKANPFATVSTWLCVRSVDARPSKTSSSPWILFVSICLVLTFHPTRASLVGHGYIVVNDTSLLGAGPSLPPATILIDPTSCGLAYFAFKRLHGQRRISCWKAIQKKALCATNQNAVCCSEDDYYDHPSHDTSLTPRSAQS